VWISFSRHSIFTRQDRKQLAKNIEWVSERGKTPARLASVFIVLLANPQFTRIWRVVIRTPVCGNLFESDDAAQIHTGGEEDAASELQIWFLLTSLKYTDDDDDDDVVHFYSAHIHTIECSWCCTETGGVDFF
jgi:hypothetical protein